MCVCIYIYIYIRSLANSAGADHADAAATVREQCTYGTLDENLARTGRWVENLSRTPLARKRPSGPLLRGYACAGIVRGIGVAKAIH